MKYLFNWERDSRNGWRRTFLWWRFKVKRPTIPPNHWPNPKIDFDHKILWGAFGPDFQWWFQLQDYGQWACGLTWFSFGWLHHIES